MPPQVTVIDHPVVAHKLSLLRRADTPSATFRTVLRELSGLLAYELTRDLPVVYEAIQTPLEEMRAPRLEGRSLVVVGILRAGIGIVEGMLNLIPTARIGHIGLYRDPATLEAVEYYFKVPSEMGGRDVIVVDPMLATGHTAALALDRLVPLEPRSIKFACILAAPEGIAHVHERHPQVPIVTAAIDRELNGKGYILPGLGDAGDRIFGTS